MGVHPAHGGSAAPVRMTGAPVSSGGRRHTGDAPYVEVQARHRLPGFDRIPDIRPDYGPVARGRLGPRGIEVLDVHARWQLDKLQL